MAVGAVGGFKLDEESSFSAHGMFNQPGLPKDKKESVNILNGRGLGVGQAAHRVGTIAKVLFGSDSIERPPKFCSSHASSKLSKQRHAPKRYLPRLEGFR